VPADMRRAERGWALGLMSGTSMDGVDAALLRTDGLEIRAFGPSHTLPYPEPLRSRLRSVLGGTGPLEEVGHDLTLAHADAVRALLERARIRPRDVDVVGFHGQTVLHEPKRGRTMQIGDGALLASLVGIDVVNDFRSADMAAGGEGAPLAPLFHATLARGLPGPLAVLNIGGVANVTWVGEPARGAEGPLLAFDTGPGNALIDDWVWLRRGRRLDADGALARAGRVDEAVLAILLTDPYFRRRPPKSLDRNAFSLAPLAHLSDADGAATLAAFTARAARLATEHFPRPVLRWLVGGGGRRNPALMAALAQALEVEVAPVEDVGWDGDALEAQAFAFLAVRSVRGLPLSLPGTTGVARPTTGGRLHKAQRRRRASA